MDILVLQNWLLESIMKLLLIVTSYNFQAMKKNYMRLYIKGPKWLF